ncbi:MAG: hypothetical protein ACRC67_01310 [Inquilinus sp.]|uniref:hypothetical protein n=1 Tax=Inquilinus sp. TaxID=1932117 RepID=UPI003F30D1DC
MMSLSLIQCRPALDPPVVRLTDHVQSVADAGLTREGMRSLLIDRRLLTFAVCVVLFFAVSAAIGRSLAAQVTRRRPDLATLVIAAMILLPQGIVAGISSWVGRQAKAIGRRPLLLVGRVCSRFTPRSPRFSLASTRWSHVIF